VGQQHELAFHTYMVADASAKRRLNLSCMRGAPHTA
jgi:hypothetical protein